MISALMGRERLSCPFLRYRGSILSCFPILSLNFLRQSLRLPLIFFMSNILCWVLLLAPLVVGFSFSPGNPTECDSLPISWSGKVSTSLITASWLIYIALLLFRWCRAFFLASYPCPSTNRHQSCLILTTTASGFRHSSEYLDTRSSV
jgi:hypothetical protein